MKASLIVLFAITTLAPFRTEAQASEPTHQEVSDMAGDMYRAYMAGGLALMLATENRCWAKVTGPSTLKTAKLCASAAIAGAMVEAAFAQREMRGPGLPYNGANVRDRVVQKSKMDEKLTNAVRIFAVESQNDVIGGLSMAGMP